MIEFNLTVSENVEIAGQLAVFRGDHNADGSPRTDAERLIDAVGVKLGDDVARLLRSALDLAGTVRWNVIATVSHDFARITRVDG